MSQVTGYLDYNPITGSLAFANQHGGPLTTFELISIQGFYTGTPPTGGSLFDVYEKHKFFTLNPNGIASSNFGPLMTPGLEPSVLAADLCLNGSRLEGGLLTNIDLRVNGKTWPLTGDPAACRAVPSNPVDPVSPVEPQPGYLDYDPATGRLTFDTLGAPPLTTFDLTSILGVFTGDRPERQSLFDLYEKHRFFTLTPTGTEEPDFGTLMAPGIEPSVLAGDLCLSGTRLGIHHLAKGGTLDGTKLRVGTETWPLTGDPSTCRAVPKVLRTTIEPIDFYLDYDQTTGSLSVDSTGQRLGSVVLRSTNDFVGETPDLLGELEIGESNSLTYSDSVLGYGTLAGFEKVAFGPVIAPGTPPEEITTFCFRAEHCGKRTDRRLVRPVQRRDSSAGLWINAGAADSRGHSRTIE